MDIQQNEVDSPKIIRTVAKVDEPFVYPCVFPHPSVSCTNGTGINFEIFEIVMSTLGLNYTVVTAAEGESGFLHEGEWHGMIGQLLRNEVDMTATLVSINEERLTAVDFSSPASFYFKGFLLQRPNAIEAAAVPTFLATPFSSTVWACFAGSLVVYIFLAFLARLFLRSPGVAHPLRYFRDSVMDVARSPLGQTEPRPYSESLRLTLNYLNVPMFFLMNFYTAALTGTLMFMGKPPDPFTGYDELAKLIRDSKFTLVAMGSVTKFLPPLPNESVVENHPDTIIRRAFPYNPPVMVSTLEQAARAVEKNKSLVFWSSYNQVLEAKSYSCDVYVIEDTFTMPTWLAFAFRKGDPLQTIVSKSLYTDTSVESFMKRMYLKYTRHNRCPDDSDSEEGGRFFSLTLRHLQGAYFILVYGLALATPAFLGEYLVRKVARRNQNQTKPSVNSNSRSAIISESASTSTLAPPPLHTVRTRSIMVEMVENSSHKLSVSKEMDRKRSAVSYHTPLGTPRITLTDEWVVQSVTFRCNVNGSQSEEAVHTG